MAPMPFYADPNRFSTPVWQADPTQGWAQGQFIQQIAPATQPGLEYTPQQYSNGIYQTAYQQAPSFESNAFYTTGAVQVLSRPPSASNQPQLTSRPNGSYSHTSSPVTAQSQNNQRTNISAQYQQEYSTNNQNYVAPATTPTGNVDSSQSGISRPDSVNSANSVPSNNQNFQTQHTGNFTPISSSNFSPVSNTSSSFASSNMSGNSGNAMPGYPPVSSHPQLASHNYSGGYPGDELSGQSNQIESSVSKGNWSTTWDQTLNEQSCNNTSAKQECDEAAVQQYASSQQNHIKNDESNYTHQQNGNNHDKIVQSEIQETDKSQSDRIHLNSRIKTMILNKQQQQQLENKIEAQKVENNKTGHFLSFSHHHRPLNLDDGGGAPSYQNPFTSNNQINFIKEAIQQNYTEGHQNKWDLDKQKTADHKNSYATYHKLYKEHVGRCSEDGFTELPKYKLTKASPVPSDSSPPDSEKVKGTVGLEIPPCNCLPYQALPEPGSYYTHLGCANSVAVLRKDLESRTGVNGKAIRIEKICYTGKEGKTPQGCPIAKWIIRRANYEEKYLIIIKQRPGHFCHSAVIVVCIVAWEGVLQGDADTTYAMLCEKLNKYGVPTNRRCATNEPRTCACQGLDPENCGASFSFGCSWSMYYNGCKYARSKTVRKFRLSVRSEEEEVESRLQRLATYLSPLYKVLAPQSFHNQCQYESIAGDCRLGLEAGQPFSGVTACLDFCAHAHKDTHNMNNGCTVVVTLTKHRGLSKPDEEQLHVLPLYVIDGTDEFGSRKHQEEKVMNGSIEVLYRYQCEVRVRNIPQESCRRSGKKRKEEGRSKAVKKEHTSPLSNSSLNNSPNLKTPGKQLQSNHVSSTSGRQNFAMSARYDHASELYYIPSEQFTVVEKHPVNKISFKFDEGVDDFSNRMYKDVDTVLHRKQTDTALNMTYPYLSHTNNNPYIYENNLHLPYPNLDYNIKSAAIQVNEHFPYNHVSNSFSNQNNEIKSNINGVWPTKLEPHLNSPSKNNLPPFSFFKNSKKFSPFPQSPDSIFVQNPFDDSVNHYHQNHYDCDNDLYSYAPWFSENKTAWSDPLGWSPPSKPIFGEVKEVIDNTHCFNDSQIGGVAIALSHGSVLFECAKHELHATTALKNPNRKSPTRISLVFYQHRNMNKAKHGWDEHEEKMRLRKLDSKNLDLDSVNLFKNLDDDCVQSKQMMMRVPTMTTISLTTVFPMYPCVVTGPYRGVTSAQQVY